MLTAAVRDLHLRAPQAFLTDVRTPWDALWENNPHVNSLPASNVERIQCHYPLIQKSNSGLWHFIHGFHRHLSEKLGIAIEPSVLKGDIHLSSEERNASSLIRAQFGIHIPFWLAVSGGKLDFTAKWWAPQRMQEVVNAFRERVLFVQIGERGHHHPTLDGVLDLRGKTTLRELILLMHHAQGVVCPVTLAMHLCAAVETKGRCEAYPEGMPPLRPCVVIGGGREPIQWEAYPGHQYIHTIGALDCCATGGCWRSRAVPLRDGDSKDRSLCRKIVRIHDDTGERISEPPVPGEIYLSRAGTQPLPRCMDMISAEEVIRRINIYFEGGSVKPLTPHQANECARRIPQLGWAEKPLSQVNGVEVPLASVKDATPFQTQGRCEAILTCCILVSDHSLEIVRKCISSLRRSLLDGKIKIVVGSVRPTPHLSQLLRRLCMERTIALHYSGGPSDTISDIARFVLTRCKSQYICWFEASTWFRSSTTAEELIAKAGAKQNPFVIGMQKAGPANGERRFRSEDGSMGLSFDSLSSAIYGDCWLTSRESLQQLDLDALLASIYFQPGAPKGDRLAGGTGPVAPGVKNPEALIGSRASIGAPWSSRDAGYSKRCLTRFEATARGDFPFPAERFRGRGITICTGGVKYFTNAFICASMLRKLGCKLPIQFWHRGTKEMSEEMKALVLPLEVECVNAETLGQMSTKALGGWELKPFSILHTRFSEVLALDADNVPVVNPEYLFDAPEYRSTGALFWPDYGRLDAGREIWRICGVEYRDEPEFESGQILVDKSKSWKALNLTMVMNEHSEYFYKYIHGDKETFHMAWRRLNAPYAMPQKGPSSLTGCAMVQYDFQGRRLFQHRNTRKWSLFGANAPVADFWLEEECLAALTTLRSKWSIARTRALPVATKRHNVVRLRAPMNSSTGYGLHAAEVFSALQDSGSHICVHPLSFEETYAPVPDAIQRHFSGKYQHGGWELILSPPFTAPKQSRNVVYSTMWETTRLPMRSVQFLNRAELVIVPTEWNKECFHESGVNRPIEVVPLGIHTQIFVPREPRNREICVFGTAGRSDSDPVRKGFNDVVSLFKDAFPCEQDVELWVKVFPHCKVINHGDPRIRIFREYFEPEQLSKWFGGISAFVSMARGEGWGLMQHQAMASARPVVGASFGGVAEFFNSVSTGYPVSWKLTPASGQFAGCGMWAEPSRHSVISAMREIYHDRATAEQKGRSAAAAVQGLSWSSSGRKLLSVLATAGVPVEMPK